MSIIWPSSSEVNYFDDGIPGPQGVEGWWSDNIVKGRRVFWFDGTWWKRDKKLPYNGYKDVAIDAFFFPKRASWKKEFWFHHGFSDYADIGWNLMKDKMMEVDNPIVMGHSMGGSVAQIVALRYAVETGKPVDCFTGGSATAWGNDAASSSFRKLVKGVNFQNGWDIVSNLHWISWLACLYPACETIVINQGTFKERMNSKNFFINLKNFILFPFTDHFAIKYDSILESFIRNYHG